MQQTVDVILLTYKPTKQVMQLIDLLETQTYPVHKIIIMNTEEKYFEKLFYGTGYLEKYSNIEVHHLSAKEFDHGKTRNNGTAYSDADIFMCMTHDAVPADNKLIENLVKKLNTDEHIAAAYARQLPLPDCRELECYTRAFNYPDTSRVKSKADIPELGIKTFFCSNVCAAYNRKIFDMLGGFEKKAIFNEDMIYAGHAVKAGYKIAYVAEAKVLHSHNFTCKQQFKRNFDLGVSQARHPEVFGGISSEKEGIKLVTQTVNHLARSGKFWQIPYLFVQSGAKYMGYHLGTHYKRLPYGIIKRCTSNKAFW